jgi:hypothetical protein
MRVVARCERKEEERCRSVVAWERTSLCDEGSRGGMVLDRDRTAQELRFWTEQTEIFVANICMA